MSAARGGAIYQTGAASRGYISNTLVYSNTSRQAFGAGIRVEAGAMTITHGTLANNVGGAGLLAGRVRPAISTIPSSGATPAPPSAHWRPYCNIDQGGTAGTAIDPRFVSPGVNEDYRVLSKSPAVDACVGGLAKDIMDSVRPLGAGYDMGAHEALVRQVFLPLVTKQ